jgi:hypothetical protein
VSIDVHTVIEEPAQPGEVFEIELVIDQTLKSVPVQRVQQRGVGLFAGVIEGVLVAGRASVEQQSNQELTSGLTSKLGQVGGFAVNQSFLFGTSAYVVIPQQAYIEGSGSSNLPTSPDVDSSKFSPLVQKGIKLLQETKEITQFFNRDSSDALQTTADTALTKFLDKPGDVAKILKDWQAAAQQVWNS